jgi:hypothetical protein
MYPARKASNRHRSLSGLFLVAVGVASLAVLSPTAVQAANISSHLEFPWAASQSWSFYGPYNFGDVGSAPWNSLDFSGGDGRVLAARSGTWSYIADRLIGDQDVSDPFETLPSVGSCSPSLIRYFQELLERHRAGDELPAYADARRLIKQSIRQGCGNPGVPTVLGPEQIGTLRAGLGRCT